ncbi:allophanate hydrolase [Chromohalobacter sp. 48-RD10]|uniref:allophanate hydrolase n=1 Tax=Chromohalobacter sp. 48-RD10 TaxID=2994063 RepID=UPI0024695C3F|nr:allophanate hydrolase [Chromohalobacter sp. 48-RD10]
MMDLTITALHEAYRAGELTPAMLIDQLLCNAEGVGADSTWITRLTRGQLEPYLRRLEGESPGTRPLYGIPFAIKDNIDLAGIPTTAACSAYAYTPTESAFVVQQLVQAGAIPMGKTNLDQFATGLVGERSPEEYGTPDNAFDPAYIPGGSSSGSAVATASGQVSFALGTDTAGSGRVPASFNNLFGLKPTLGLLSKRGVVPACATLDTISLFTLTADDAHTILNITARLDPECAWSRSYDFTIAGKRYGQPSASFRFGVPPESQWQTDAAHTEAMNIAIRELESLGGERVDIDCSAMLAAARLLYEGPWVAERYHAVRELIDRRPEALHPATREIIEGGRIPLAVDAFDSHYQLAEFKRLADAQLDQVDVMLTPTVVTHPSKTEVANDPIGLNSQLGRWTNFMNLLDYSALAIPVRLSKGLPQGVTLFSKAFDDLFLLSVGRALESSSALPLGATHIPRSRPTALPPASDGTLELVVCGAHLEGLALNHQLTDRHGYLVARTQSAACYRLLALPGEPARPAMVRDDAHGRVIDVEVWRLPIESVGSLLSGIASPLGLGKVELADGRWVSGFIAAAGALEGLAGTQDITHHGGWRQWLQTQASDSPVPASDTTLSL